jgi:hypothetical protein
MGEFAWVSLMSLTEKLREFLPTVYERYGET